MYLYVISVLAALIYILDTIALITALCVIPMFPNGNPNRIILVVCLVVGGFVFFGALSKFGEKYLNFTINNGRGNMTTETSASDISSTKDKEGSLIDNIIAEDDNLRKVSLGAQAARKV